MKVLVCGGRDNYDREFIYDRLDFFHAKYPFTQVIHGGATGADSIADDWAKLRGVDRRVFSVSKEEWKSLGKSAGPKRNQRMIDECSPNIVIAFRGGRGTRSMVDIAKRYANKHKCDLFVF